MYSVLASTKPNLENRELSQRVWNLAFCETVNYAIICGMGNLIPRLDYLNCLDEHCGKHLIKVLTGMRRTGKSTILRLFAESLRKDGVRKR